jgi:pimeloyl-ACP methyl ester carboxylesterase
MSSRTESFFRSTTTDVEVARKWIRMLTVRPLPDERFEALVDAGSRVPHHAAIEAFESWTRADFADAARTIATPTLVIAGAEDRPQTPDFLRETIVEVIPGARMTVVEGAGHYVHLERKEHVASLIEGFVHEIAGAT